MDEHLDASSDVDGQSVGGVSAHFGEAFFLHLQAAIRFVKRHTELMRLHRFRTLDAQPAEHNDEFAQDHRSRGQ